VPAVLSWWTRDVAELSPGADPRLVESHGADLVGRLGEPHRRYHTSQHVLEMFRALGELEEAGALGSRDCALARVAACFHDVVYDTDSAPGANERASAELAVRSLRALAFTSADVDVVRGLVLATQAHDLSRDQRDQLGAAFHDADLWILSSPAPRYAEYTAQVREEYAAVPDEAFRAGRAAILRPFLDRRSIYATGHARAEWEPRAREQLAREICALES
jgi:predicted metal-dependent HD superfamily phosphohydrolase